MSARTVRLKKEARALFWPWCIVMLAGLTSWVHYQPNSVLRGSIMEGIVPLGFFAGIPLLATLSFGNEFQQRTVDLLLVQPVARMEIWREKLIVTTASVASAAVVFLYPGSSVHRQEQLVVAGLYVIATTAAATFWTLSARTTIGGLVLGHIAVAGFELAGFTLNTSLPGFVDRLLEGNLPRRETVTALSILSIVALGYAVLMLWLGARKLARFQVTGGLPGDDLVVTVPTLFPGALAKWFRIRPTEPIFNLIRKELRLLRPLWLIALLVVLYMTCLTVFRLFPDAARMKSNFTGWVLVLSPLVAIPLMAILAGCLSLGDERTSGTHSWHLTLPVSAGRQWLIKLLVAVFTGFFCAVLLPVLVLVAGGNLSFGGPVWFVNPRAALDWMYTVPVLILVSFWCACAVNGTVRAALWVFPAMGAVLLGGRCGGWVAPKMMDLVISKFDLFTNFTFTNSLSNVLQSSVIYTMPVRVVMHMWVPTLLIAVIQSYRLFRSQVADGVSPVMRKLAIPAATAFLYTFSLAAVLALVSNARDQMWTLFRETHEAIERVSPGTPNLDAAHPLQLTVEDLARAYPLSERTRRWLRNARISVTPDTAHLAPNLLLGKPKGVVSFPRDKAYAWYIATIRLTSGTECTLAFQSGIGVGLVGGVCE